MILRRGGGALHAYFRFLLMICTFQRTVRDSLATRDESLSVRSVASFMHDLRGAASQFLPPSRFLLLRHALFLKSYIVRIELFSALQSASLLASPSC